MTQQEHPREETKREPSKKAKTDKVPQRGPSIAVLENLRREENLKRAVGAVGLNGGPSSEPSAAGVVLHSPIPQQSPAFPLLPMSSSTGSYPVDFALPRPSLVDSISETMNSITQMTSGDCHQMELELPSSQSQYGTANASSWADQQMMMHKMVGMDGSWPFHVDGANALLATIPVRQPVRYPRCNSIVTSGMEQSGSDLSGEAAWSSSKVRVNPFTCHEMKRNVVNQQVASSTIHSSLFSMADTSLASRSSWPVNAMPIRQPSFNLTQKKETRDRTGINASKASIPLESQVFYNFMGLPDDAFDANVTSKPSEPKEEGTDLDLKL
ncbi:hypothetical protein HPP92_011460 [Vanilla planifolia]|uniref:Uncharacterized protein n=1 Tax=Vanilla planifolia TaxID=51239 RepID=A0A835R5Q8_VANPL|nr:hypothetical protein HPP92_011460 [Vanilla planifolia]